MSSKNILFVGFGIPGLRTLEALDALVALNPEFRDVRQDGMHYLAIENREQSLRDFEDYFASRELTDAKSVVEGMLLSVPELDECLRHVISKTINLTSDDPVKSCFMEHWWFDEGLEPFVYGHRRDLTVMRMPCAIENYGVAWFRMRRMEASIQRFLEQIVARKGKHALENVQIYFVAGLDDEMGRGAWSPVMFKIREVLRDQYGVMAQTKGVFFGPGGYHTSPNDNPERSLVRKINSFTGLSELSAWLRNQSLESPMHFRLPELNASCDSDKYALNSGSEQDLDIVSPLTEAYIICGNPSIQLHDSNEYYKMAGEALCQLACNQFIRGAHVNELAHCRGLTIRSFGIDEQGIQAYLNFLSRDMMLARLISDEGDVEKRVDECLSRIPLSVSVHRLEDIKPDTSGTLIQRIGAALLSCGEIKSQLDDLYKQLPNMELGEAKRRVQVLLHTVTDGLVSKIVSKAINSVDGKNNDQPRDLIQELEKEAVRVAKLGDFREYNHEQAEHLPNAVTETNGIGYSIGRVRKFMQRLIEKLNESRMSSIRDFSFEDPSDKTGNRISAREWIVNELTIFSRRGMAERLLGRNEFNEVECRRLLEREGELYAGEIPTAILCASYQKICEAIADVIAPVEKYAKNICRICLKVIDRCHVVREREQLWASKSWGNENGRAPIHQFFATPDDIADSVPSQEHGTCRLVLKPIVFGEGEIRMLLMHEGNACIDDGAIDTAFKEAFDVFRRQVHDNDKEKYAIETFVNSCTRSVKVADSLLESRFSFGKVLMRNWVFWNLGLQGDGQYRDYLESRIFNAFGVLPDKANIAGEMPEGLRKAVNKVQQEIASWQSAKSDADTGPHRSDICETVLPYPDVMCLSAARRLVNLCAECSARSDGSGDGVSPGGAVFIPWDESFLRENEVRDFKDCLALANMEAVWSSDPNGKSVSPFAIVVFREYDAFKTLDWRSDSDVLRLLREAERPDGRLVFSESPIFRGLGYISPRFVRDAQLSALRWKPWVPAQEPSEETF